MADIAESWLAAHVDDLVAWRRHLHRHPELGRQEFATTQFVADRLVEAGLNPKTMPGGTGLICDLGPDYGPRIALRADMDALPMSERTGAPYASTVPNVAHACGHDAHTAVLLGAATALMTMPELPIGVRLIFQPAEELMPGGALDAIAAGALTGVSRIFALHCDPRLEVGRVAIIAGPITSAADCSRRRATSSSSGTAGSSSAGSKPALPCGSPCQTIPAEKSTSGTRSPVPIR